MQNGVEGSRPVPLDEMTIYVPLAIAAATAGILITMETAAKVAKLLGETERAVFCMRPAAGHPVSCRRTSVVGAD